MTKKEKIKGKSETLRKLIPLVFIAAISSCLAILLMERRLPSSMPNGAVFVIISGIPYLKYFIPSEKLSLPSIIHPVSLTLSANRNIKKNIIIPKKKLFI